MTKINFKKFLPLVGIGAVGVSSAIAATAIAVPNVPKNNDPKVLKLENQVLSYAMNNLTNLDVLNSPIQLANYLDDYGAFDNSNSNSVPSVDVINTKSVENEFYVKLAIKSNNNSLIENTDWLKTSIPVTDDIGTINFDNLKKQFLTFNDINIAFDFIYSTSTLINLITSNTTLNSDQILNASLNISNNFGDDLKTLSFDLTLDLNNCNSNGKTTFVVNLPTSCEIDWTSASQNFNKYFNVDSVGTSITSIKDNAATQEILIIPETYTNDEGEQVTIQNIESLLPEASTTTTINTKIIIMPNSIKVIGNNAFGVEATTGQKFNNLKWINLSTQLAKIGNYAFANCTNLQNLPLYSLEYLTEIGQSAFLYCTSLTSVYMNDVLQSIGIEMFKGCSSLLNVRLSRSPLITSIPKGVFNRCSKLKSVVLPKTITTIDREVFAYCSALAYLNMPLNLKSIGAEVFTATSSVKNLVFLNNGTVNQIQFNAYAFFNMGNSNFTNIYIFGEYTTGSKFSNCFNSANNINVSVESKTVYDKIHDGNTSFSLSRVFIMDPENLPYVTVSHIPEFIEYWQNRAKTAADVNFNGKKVASFKDGSTAAGGVIFNNDWVGVVEILNITNNNNEVYRIQFQVTLNNKQYFEINVPLLTPIQLP